MDLSIVITTYNRAPVLERLLLGLEDQTDCNFQVVVAIDGSTDGTEEMLAGLKTAYDLKWVNTHCTGYGLAVARNMGIAATDGEAVVIIDDDSFPEPGFVAAHKQSVVQRTITGGPRNPADPADVRMAWKMRELGRLPARTSMSFDQLRQEWPHAYLIENNICLFREDWIDIGLFSERLKMYGFIGQEFFARAEYLGYSYQYNPDAAILHHGEIEGDNGFLRKKKLRQIRLATFLRPTLMTPAHYQAQVEWARCLSEGRPETLSLPPFLLKAGLAFPWRYMRAVTTETRRHLRRWLC
ncbi:glycosyltransferase family 2 protein [Desulfuromonas sp. TF]|uniref:glycosyltransferase family 2 protein n=1 Tax=Desulfuromonas sp. TF TaxID=1232410 RepID=UPI000488B0F2|nr:glycosyltransferase family 2 protein [Desulfuromonas sp. TF]